MFSWLKRKSLFASNVKVVPRIKHKNFITGAMDVIVQKGMPDEEMSRQVPINESIVGDLILAYAIDVGPCFMFIDENKIKEHGLNRSDLRTQAMKTIWQELGTGATIHELDKLKVLKAPNNLAACSILFPEMWQKMEVAYGSPIIAGFIHRDFVLFGTGSDPSQIAQMLVELTTAEPEHDNHNLSRTMYSFENGTWQEFASKSMGTE